MADKKNKNAENEIVDSIANEEQSPQPKTSLSESQLQNKQKYAYIIKRKKVRQRARRKTVSLIMLIFILVALLITGLVYGVLTFIDFNSFRITIDRNNLDYLILSEDYEFRNPTSVLSVSGPKNMDNWTYDWLPITTDFATRQGSLSEANYIACSFYLENRGDDGVYYSENITLTNTLKKLEDAIRILLVKQEVTQDESGNLVYGTPTYRCFAKVSADGVTPEFVAGGDSVIPVPVSNPNNPGTSEPWYAEPFYAANSGIVLDATYYPLMPDQKIRYVMCVWIEGTDPECTNDKLGGRVSYTFQFSLLTDEHNNAVLIEE